MMFYSDLLCPKINFFLNKIKNNEFFCFCKLNHAFWDALTNFQHWNDVYTKLHGNNCLNEVVSVVQILPAEVMVGVEYKPFIFKNYYENEKNNKMKIFEIFGNRKSLFYGGIWKYYTTIKKMEIIFDCINENNMTVILCGLEHTKFLYKIFLKFQHFKLNLNSYDYKENVLKDLLEKINNVEGKKIVLLQAGDLFSTWLISKLSEHKIICIDMGRSLDFFIDKRKIVLSKEDIRISFLKTKKSDIFCGSIANQLWY